MSSPLSRHHLFLFLSLCLTAVRIAPAFADPPRALSGGIAPDDIPTVAQSRPIESLSLVLGLQSAYAHRPADGVVGVVPVVALGLFRYIELGVSLPLSFGVGESAVPAAARLRAWTKLAVPGLLRRPGGTGLGLSLSFGATWQGLRPTKDDFLLSPGIVLDHRTRWGLLRTYNMRVDFRLPEEGKPLWLATNLDAGASIPLIRPWGVWLWAAGHIGLMPLALPKNFLDLEVSAHAGLQLRLPKGWYCNLGAGVERPEAGVAAGVGLLGCAWTPVGSKEGQVFADSRRAPDGDGSASTRMSMLPDEPDDACVALQTLGFEQIMERARARGLVRKVSAGSGSLPLMPGRAYAGITELAEAGWVLTDKAREAGIPPGYSVLAAGCTMTLLALWYVIHDRGSRPSLPVPKARAPETRMWTRPRETPAPEPQPRPDRTADPIPGPDTPRESRPECMPVPVKPHRGGSNNQRHHDCADRVPPNEFPGHDVRVGGKLFDAKTVGAKELWEIKADDYTTWDMPDEVKERIVLPKEVRELERERQIAESCGYRFIVGVADSKHMKALKEQLPKLDIRKVTCP